MKKSKRKYRAGTAEWFPEDRAVKIWLNESDWKEAKKSDFELSSLRLFYKKEVKQ